MSLRLSRANVRLDQTWKLEDLFATRAAWLAGLSAAEEAVTVVVAFKGRLGESGAILEAALNAQERLMERLYRLEAYAALRLAEDGGNTARQADCDLAASLVAESSAATAFIRSEITALPRETVERYIEQEPGLASLRLYLEKVLQGQPHMLTPQTEVALAALSEIHDAPYAIYERVKNADMTFPSFTDREDNEVGLSFALYEDVYETDPDALTRSRAFNAFTKGLKGYQNTLAATFATEVKKRVVLARLRGYPSATHMLLQEHDVTLQARDNLIDILQDELAPHMQRYARLRCRVLGLDRLRYCDIEAPLDPTYNPTLTYKEACNVVLEALSVLGPEYSQIMQSALRDRWVDLVDNVGKATGAFCSSPFGGHSYILMTWTGSMRGAFTLAHELGHAGHFELANRHQRLFNTDPSMFFVEAPSTLNELLLGQHLLSQRLETRMRRWILLQILATYHHNFVRHLLEAELQRRVFALAEAGEAITASTLSDAKGEILTSFWGDTVTIDEGACLTWMRQPHYYMGMYPYTYAAGLTTATAMARLIREEGEPAVHRWLGVLKAGGTRRPLTLARMAGVDMSQVEPIRSAVSYVGSLVEELERSFA